MLLSFVAACLGFLWLWPLGAVFLGLFTSLWLATYSREFVNVIVEREALKSELLFCYAYQAGILLLKDTTTGEIHGVG